MDKIIALGSMNSGKTTYLVGMYQAMGNVIENFSLNAKDDGSDLQLDTMWEKMIEEGMPPDTCKRLEVFNFQLVHKFRPVCDIEWIEYDVDFSQYESQRFQDEMKNTDCLLLFVDGEIFHIPDARSVDDYCQKLHSRLLFNQSIRRLFNVLFKCISAEILLPPISIVVTKADLIDPKYQEVVRSALHKRFSAIFDTPECLVLKVAVSLGGAIKPGFIPDPHCLEEPIVFALLTILLNHIKEMCILIKKNENFILRLINTVSVQKVIYVGGAEKNFRNYFKARFHISPP